MRKRLHSFTANDPAGTPIVIDVFQCECGKIELETEYGDLVLKIRDGEYKTSGGVLLMSNDPTAR